MNTKETVHFYVLQTLFLAGLVFHQTESWDFQWLAGITVAALMLSFFKKIQAIAFLIAAAVVGIEFLDGFPNLANHSNLQLFIILTMLPASLLVVAGRTAFNYQNLLIALRLFTFITYFFAAFHKLNLDFFNPEISCANDKIGEYVAMLPRQLDSFLPLIQGTLPVIGFLTEAIIPFALVIPRFRRLGIMFQCGLHFMLAPLGFSDFSSTGMALAWSFVDPELLNTEKLVSDLKKLVGAVLVLVLGLAIFRFPEQIQVHEFFEGFAFMAIYIPFVVRNVFPNVDTGFLAFPRSVAYSTAVLILFIFGFSNYLGLRTAGTFSMFSNLRTEGPVSNHLLLGGNPFKIFPYQDDLVEVLDISDEAEGAYQDMPYRGQQIPKIEFARLLDYMREDDFKGVRMQVRYGKSILSTSNAAFDGNFPFHAPWWQKKMFKFRPVEAGPSICVW